MKNLLKFSIAICCVALMFACGKDKADEDTGNGDYLCEFTSFGFYAEDNEGVLSVDYMGVISGSTIAVVMSEDIDKTALKARFTVTEGDVVKVSTKVFESKVTAHNYTGTVDFVVSDPASKMSKVYSVKMQKPTAKTWSKVGTLGKGLYDIKNSSAKMSLNSKDNLPYIVYSVEELIGDVKTTKINVAKWNGSAFVMVGPEAFSRASSGGPEIDFNNAGQPYVLYVESKDEDGSTTSNRSTVMTYSGMQWSVVGSPRFNTAKCYSNTGQTALAVDANSNPVVLNYINDKSSAFNRGPEVSYYSGNGWTSGVTLPNRPPVDGSAYASMKVAAKRFGDKIYLVTANNGMTGSKPNGYSIYKYAGGSVSTVIEGGLIDPASTATSTQDLSFDIAPDGTIYFLSADDNGGTWQLRVFTYKEGDAAPKQFGSTIAHAVTSSSSYTIALDKNNVPYVAFNKSDVAGARQLMIVNYDFELGKWSDAVAVSNVDVKVNPLKIFLDFTDDNIGYAGAMIDASPYEFALYKLTSAN